MLRRGDLSQNYELQEGDKLEVPIDTTSQIKVLGYIQRPGLLPYREPMTLVDAISAAGGEIPNRSMMSQIRIIRQKPGAPGTYEEIRPNIINFWMKGDASQNVEHKPGDFIYVPATKTPDFGQISGMVNSVIFIESILRNGLFGFRLFR
jgi:protein involved in polysaccharide export with SLBB domain